MFAQETGPKINFETTEQQVNNLRQMIQICKSFTLISELKLLDKITSIEQSGYSGESSEIILDKVN